VVELTNYYVEKKRSNWPKSWTADKEISDSEKDNSVAKDITSDFDKFKEELRLLEKRTRN
jgi:hypothetical protein